MTKIVSILLLSFCIHTGFATLAQVSHEPIERQKVHFMSIEELGIVDTDVIATTCYKIPACGYNGEFLALVLSPKDLSCSLSLNNPDLEAIIRYEVVVNNKRVYSHEFPLSHWYLLARTDDKYYDSYICPLAPLWEYDFLASQGYISIAVTKPAKMRRDVCCRLVVFTTDTKA